MDGFHLPISQFTYISYCTQGLPGVAESNTSLSEGYLLPGEKVPVSADEGWGKFSCLALTHRLRRSPLSPRKSVMLDDGFCDFAFGSAQNDRVGIGMSESFSD